MINFNQEILNNPNPTAIPLTEAETGIDTTTSMLFESLVELEEEFFQINENHLISMHMGITYDCPEIITEGVSDMITSAIEFFKKLGKKIADFFRKIFMTISSYMGDFGKFIKKHKDELEDFDPDFHYEGYDYTIDNAPNLLHVDRVVNSYLTDVTRLDKITKEKLEEERNSFDQDSNIDRIRGDVLNSKTSISRDNFEKEVKAHFRNGKDEPTKLYVDQSVLRKILNSYSELDKEYSESKKMRDKVILLVSNLEKFFEKGASVGYSGSGTKIIAKDIDTTGNTFRTGGNAAKYENTADNKEIVSKFFNLKFHQANIISSMVITVATQKVIAQKEQLKQCRQIVRQSMQKKNQKNKGGEKDD